MPVTTKPNVHSPRRLNLHVHCTLFVHIYCIAVLTLRSKISWTQLTSLFSVGFCLWLVS